MDQTTAAALSARLRSLLLENMNSAYEALNDESRFEWSQQSVEDLAYTMQCFSYVAGTMQQRAATRREAMPTNRPEWMTMSYFTWYSICILVLAVTTVCAFYGHSIAISMMLAAALLVTGRLFDELRTAQSSNRYELNVLEQECRTWANDMLTSSVDLCTKFEAVTKAPDESSGDASDAVFKNELRYALSLLQKYLLSGSPTTDTHTKPAAPGHDSVWGSHSPAQEE